MGNMSIRSRLILLVGFLSAALIAIGSISYLIASSAEDEIETIFTHQAQPMRELARIRRLVVENSGQVFRAVQHNPAFEYARLHDHPISMHLDIIEKNVKWMDETFATMRKHLLPDSEELRILDEFEPLYQKYNGEVLQPTLSALRSGNYSAEMMATFLKANGEFERKMNPLLRSMAEAQEKAVKDSYETSTAQFRRFVRISLITLLIALISGLIMGVYTIRSVTRPLGEMQSMITHASREHDFTGRISVHANDEVGKTATAFNDLLQSMQQSLGEVRQGIIRIDDATAALASASKQASTASMASSESASSMAASVEEMSVSINSVTEHTHEALNIANAAGEHSETGGAIIGDAISAMAEIVVQVRDVGTAITELGQHSNQISTVVQVIKEVADQTNLLALNAAIEAARAGEQGRGFAVVADEVRKLAERTSKATEEIAGMVNDIQIRSHSAVDTMERTIGSLEKGSELAAKAGEAITAIRSANAEVQRVFSGINEAMREQGAASYDIAQKVERVAQASEESSSSVDVSAGEATKIRNLANDMRNNIERFRV